MVLLGGFFVLHFKNLKSGDILKQTVPNTTGRVAWASDNQTIFYTSKNKVTLLSEKIYFSSIVGITLILIGVFIGRKNQ